ncbi:MAG: hypothetical protein ACRERU_19680, partial [Methylococcales bacterium]
MKRVAIALLFSLVSCDFGDSPGYEYKTVAGNSPYSDWKDDRYQAMEAAQAEFRAFAKSECRRVISNG